MMSEADLDDEIILLDLMTEFEEYGLDEEFVRECFERNNRQICETYMELTAAISTGGEIAPYRIGANLEQVVDPWLVPAGDQLFPKEPKTDDSGKQKKGRKNAANDKQEGDKGNGKWNLSEQFPNNMASYASVMNDGREEIQKLLITKEFMDNFARSNNKDKYGELKKRSCERLLDLHMLTTLGAKQAIIRLAADLRSHQNHHIQFVTGTGEKRDHLPVLGPLVEDLCEKIWGVKPTPEEGNNGRYHLYLYDYVPPF